MAKTWLDGINDASVNLKTDDTLLYGLIVCSIKEVTDGGLWTTGENPEAFYKLNVSQSPHGFVIVVYENHVSIESYFFSMKIDRKTGNDFMGLCRQTANRHDQLWPKGHVGTCRS